MASTARAPELILGRYRPLRPLGAGGMGQVWLAHDEHTGLDVSLKVVNGEGKAGERAEREARAAAALRHPRCQRIYALARDATHVYIAYEYVAGKTFRQALSAGDLGDRDAVEAAAQLLDALNHAHSRGIVHRDVKPSNVLLAESAAVDVRLLDFGLAQMADFETLTGIGDVPGTLAYCSPERLSGAPAEPAADVWAVGVMLWEALAGHHPFRASSAAETTDLILAGAPPLEEHRPDLPTSIHDALRRALDLDHLRRPAPASLAAALRAPSPRRAHAAGERRSGQRTLPSFRPLLGWLADALLPAAAAALWTGWVTSTLPFYPAGWPLGLTLLAAALGLAFPPSALPFALVVTVFPLANVSIGLASLFALVAGIWAVATAKEPRAAAVAVAGPILWACSGLALLPVVALLVRNPVRRALSALGGFALAASVAAIEGARLPFDPSAATPRLPLGTTEDPFAVASALAQLLATHLVVVEEAGVLAAAALVLPYLRGRGLPVAALGAGSLLAVTVLLAPAAPILPLALAAWATAAVLALVPRLLSA